MQPSVLLEYSKRLRSMAHLGLTYSTNEYDIDRYKQLEKISLEMMAQLTEEPVETFSVYFNDKKEYITPKKLMSGPSFSIIKTRFCWLEKSPMGNGRCLAAGLISDNRRRK